MEAFIITSAQYKSIVDALSEIKAKLAEQPKKSTDDFIDNESFIKLMNISKRTAQTWRDTRVIAFSQIGGKIYYKNADVEEMLKSHYHNPFKKPSYGK